MRLTIFSETKVVDHNSDINFSHCMKISKWNLSQLTLTLDLIQDLLVNNFEIKFSGCALRKKLLCES